MDYFSSWAVKHLDHLSLDYYFGFYKDYGKKIRRSSANHDPDFKKILDYYFTSLYKSQIFSLRLNDMVWNCQRLAKIPSKNLTYRAILETYNRELTPENPAE